MRFSYLAGLSLCLSGCSVPVAQDAPSPETVFGTSPTNYAKIADENFVAKGWIAKTLPELSDALASGDVSSEALTQAYLNRIDSVDRAGEDRKVLSYGYAFETVAGGRINPKYLRNAEDRAELENAMRP